MSESPCEKCNQWDDADFRRRCSEREKQAPMTEATCGLLSRYLGQQEGYAAGAWDVVDKAGENDDNGWWIEGWLSAWLEERCIERKGE